MATQILCRRTLPKSLTLASSFFSRSISTPAPAPSPFRALAAASPRRRDFFLPSSPTLRSFSTRATTSSLNDPSPNWSNRPPKETILLDGCDFEHWLVVMEKPEGEPTRDEIIDSYIKTLAKVVGSEEEARMKIYSVSTRHYYAFGALVPEELSFKLKELDRVRWVLPDSYLNVKEKDYGGEPFINGQAVPYDPKYHEEWVRNNARANERNRRDKHRNTDRSRNFDRRRGNVVSRDMQDRPPMPNQGGPVSSASNMTGSPPNHAGGYPQNTGRYSPQNAVGYPPQNAGGYPPQNAGGYPPQNAAGGYSPNTGQVPSNSGTPPQSGYGGMPTNNSMGGMPQNNFAGMIHNNRGMPPNQNMGGFQPNAGWSNTAPSRDN